MCFDPPFGDLSILNTSAPISAKSMPQKGPGPIPANSITFTLFNGPLIFSPLVAFLIYANIKFSNFFSQCISI